MNGDGTRRHSAEHVAYGDSLAWSITGDGGRANGEHPHALCLSPSLSHDRVHSWS